MTKPKVFISRKISPGAISLLSKSFETDVWEAETPPSSKILLEKALSVDGLLSMLTDQIDREFLLHTKGKLKALSQMAVGVDNIDLKTATEIGLPVGHTPGVLTDSCADFTFALLMAITRRVVEADVEVHRGIWQIWGPNVLCGADVFGSTLGIIGMGRIGQAVARRAQGFEMKLLYFDRSRHKEIEQELNARFVPLEQLLKNSDFVTLHLNLTNETLHFFGKDQFRQMKPNAYLINASRGSIVDPLALEWALENRVIAGAAIDVTDPEPLPTDSPLLKYKNLIITPHIASASIQTRATMAMVAAQNLIAGLNGDRLPYCANPEVYLSI